MDSFAIIQLKLGSVILRRTRERIHSVFSEKKCDLPVHVLVVNRLTLLEIDPASDLSRLLVVSGASVLAKYILLG